MKIIYKLIVPIFLILLAVSPVMGQVGSDNYRLVSGSFVSGGGKSFSEGYILGGAINATPDGVSASTNFQVYGGIATVNDRAGIDMVTRPDLTPALQHRIVGVPVNIPGDRGVSDVFGGMFGTYDNTVWRLGRYSSTDGANYEYPNVPAVRPGIGYWLITRAGRTMELEGSDVMLNFEYDDELYYRSSYTLDTGWNMLSNPMPYTVSWSDVLFEDGGVVQAGHPATVLDDAIWMYGNSGYYDATTIPAWNGFFVHINKPGIKILFPSKAYMIHLSPTKKDKVSLDNWAINLRLISDDMVDGYNQIGVRFDASDDVDQYDHFEPPPPPGGASLAFKSADESRRCTDFKAPFGDGAIWTLSFTDCKAGKLRFDDLENIPATMNAWLMIDDVVIQVNNETSVSITDKIKQAFLVIGTEKYMEGETDDLIPVTFALEQNYPNPFNPNTYIEFTIPQSGHVSLDIFNVLGQKVRTLLDKEMTSGTRTVMWDSHDNNGTSVATGVYFYRLQFGDMVKHKKMVLLK